MYHDDNVAFHHCAKVAAAFEEDGFFLDFLPSNMKDELQPMDVAINKKKVFIAGKRLHQAVNRDAASVLKVEATPILMMLLLNARKAIH